jgi:hypothetical protein
MSLQSHASEFAVAAGKASPPIVVSGAAVAGISLQDWVLIATLVYTSLQIALLVYNFLKKRAAERTGAPRDDGN